MRKWYNVTLDKEKADGLRVFLKKNGITYEPSEDGESIYFSVLCNESEVEAVNKFLETKQN